MTRVGNDLLVRQRSERNRFEQANDALLQGRPNILDPLLAKPLNNPWHFPPSFVHFIGEPATQRNFFVIHEHAATAYHWDLRIACSLIHGKDGTMSWAIPKGFDNLVPGERRLAVETPLHSISYSCFEGVSPKFGTTLIADFGTYSIKTSSAAHKAGRDAERETPDPEEDSQGKGEEEAFAAAYKRKAFVIHLEGMRYRMRLTMRYHDTVSTGTGMKRQWMLQLSPTLDKTYIYEDRNPNQKNRSLVTGRSMQEVRREGSVLFPDLTDSELAEGLEGALHSWKP